MRRGLRAGFCCLLILFASACSAGSPESSNPSESNGVTKVVFWDLFGGGDGTVMEDIVEEFNDLHPNIQVEKITQEWGEYYTKLTTSVLGNQAPDLGVSHATRVMQLAAEGVIQPLQTEAERNGFDFSGLTGTAVEVTTIDGNKYAVPFDYHALLLFWNKSLAEQYGVLDEQGMPKFDDYNSFIDMLNHIKEQDGDIAPLAINGGGTHPFRMWYSFYKQMGGGDIYDYQMGTSSIDPVIGLESLTAAYDLFHKHQVIPPAISNVDEVFQTGKSVFMMNGTWAVNNTYNGMKENLDVMKFPNLFGTPAVYADSHTFVLPTNPNRDPRTTDAAMTFVKWVTDHGWKWSKAGHLPTSADTLDSEELNHQPLRDRYKDAVHQMTFLPPNEKVWFASYSQLQEVFDGLWLNQYSPEEALVKIEEVINNALK